MATRISSISIECSSMITMTMNYQSGHCPKGLAKKHNGCMPPGQAKKWAIGRPLPRDVVYYDLPSAILSNIGSPPSGYRFVRVASDILMINTGTRMVMDAINDLGRYKAVEEWGILLKHKGDGNPFLRAYYFDRRYESAKYPNEKYLQNKNSVILFISDAMSRNFSSRPQFFQVNFAFRRRTAVMAGFYINQLFGFTAAKIFCSPPGCMLVEAPGDIDSDTGVERVVGAENNIDGPVHGSKKKKKKNIFN